MEIICKAIRNRALLEFNYQGHLRVVAPYCHGVSTRDVEVLRGIQVGGSSASRGFGFGKLWVVAQMDRPRVLAQTFVPDDPHYNPDDSAMKHVHCRV